MTGILGPTVLGHVHNSRAAPETDYGPMLQAILNAEGFAAAQREISGWPGYASTPLHRLSGLAETAGVADIRYKDEGGRFGLGSFKALGGAYAVSRVLTREVAARSGQGPVSAADLRAGRYRDLVAGLTVCAATDGNHGRSVSWGAQLFGSRCVIYIPDAVSPGRQRAMERFGAEVRRIDGTFDDAVRRADEDAAAQGWFAVADTTYPGYTEIPRDVMHGYGVMVAEAIAQLAAPRGDPGANPGGANPGGANPGGANPGGANPGDDDPGGDTAPPSHVFVQGGVGGLAAAVCARLWLHYGDRRPRFAVVEPEAAACFFASARAGRPVVVEGDLETVMGGLAAGACSMLAWDVLWAGADDFLTVPDSAALDVMRLLSRGAAGDPSVVAGESAVAGLAGALGALQQPEIAAALGLDAASRVLVFGTEGATDPKLYREIVGRSPEAVARGG